MGGKRFGGEPPGGFMPEVIGPQEVHLWHVAPTAVAAPGAVAACERILSTEERERAARFRRPADAHLYLVTHALTRCALSRFAPVPPERWEFRGERYGKPVIAPEVATMAGVPLAFNLSHTTGLAAVAVTAGAAVGVDVEHTSRSVRVEIAREIFSAREMAALQALPEPEQTARFFELWTLKEALAKARGEGFVCPLADCCFTLPPPASPAAPTVTFGPRVADDPQAWRFFQRSIGGDYLVAVAVRTETDVRLVIHEGMPLDGTDS